MICLLVGVYYQMVWPANLQKVCHYKCPYFVGMSNKDRGYSFATGRYASQLNSWSGNMLDPVSIGLAISTASKAFEMIQKGFSVGRELEQMHGDMGRWMSATAEIAATAEDAENAGFITRMLKGSGNIEQIATQAVLAKKQIEKQRYELMVHVRLRYGMNTWNDILKAEGQLRKAKAKALEEQRKFMERSVLIVVLTTIIGGGLFALWNWADYLKNVA
jgi:hypothetical protein